MLHSLPSPITKKPKVRVGRGSSSGHGSHTTGRGVKGQKSRTGYKRPRPGFEGGQNPLSRRLPKLKGFSRGFATANTQVYNLQLSVVAEVIEGELVNLETLAESGLVNPSSKKVTIKILFDEPISKKLIIEGIDISKNAREAVEKVGGEVR